MRVHKHLRVAYRSANDSIFNNNSTIDDIHAARIQHVNLEKNNWLFGATHTQMRHKINKLKIYLHREN